MSRTFRLKQYGGYISFDTPYCDYLTNSSLNRKEKYCIAFVELFMRAEALEEQVRNLEQRIRTLEVKQYSY